MMVWSKMKLFRNNLQKDEKHTFILHMVYSVIEGVILGVLALNEFVFIKSMGGSNLQLGVLFQLSMVVFIFLVFINEFIKRAKNKKRLLRTVGFLTRGPLFLMIFFPGDPEALTSTQVYHYIFLFLFLIYFFGNTIIYPLINLFLKTRYSHSNFGKLYSLSATVNKIVMLVSTFAYGLLLDMDGQSYRFVFPVVAGLGIISLYTLSMIRYSETPSVREKDFFKSIRQSIHTMKSILKANKSYRHFEAGFMFYGFSFMITSTVITIFFERALNLNYSSVAFYKNSYNILAILLLPYTGRLIGKLDPRKFAILTFAALLLYIFFVMLTEHFPQHTVIQGIEIYPMLLIAIFFHGIFAATMALLWFIGSAYFCKAEEAGDYQSVHLFLTAGRASVAPLFGVVFYEFFGFTLTFILGILLLGIAIGVNVWSGLNEKAIVVARDEKSINEAGRDN
jgi:Na+/melibiose symporter-like transporter